MNPYRVKLAYGLNAAGLILLAVFAVALVGIGIAVAVGAERFHEAQPQTSASAFYASGAITAIIGVVFLVPVMRGWNAVGSIDLDADGGWTLRSRFGRAMGQIAPETDRRFELTGCYRIAWSGAVFRREPKVAGVLIVGDEARFRLAMSGPATYDKAISELGFDAAAPKPGEQLVLR